MSFREAVLSDIRFYRMQESLWSSIITFFFDPRFQFVFLYRLGCLLRRIPLLRLFTIFIKYHYLIFFSSEVSLKAQIGKNFKVAHPIGIVIGDRTVIGDNCTVFQHVTFGSSGRKDRPKEYPVIEDGVTIYSGVTLIGNVRVGRNSVIGAHALVTKDIPPDCIAAGAPAKPLQK